MPLKTPNFSGFGADTITVGTIESQDATSVQIDLGDDAGDDFIVDTDKLVVEGDNGRVGIGTAAPDGPLHVMKASAGSVTASGDGNALVVESDDVSGVTLLAPDEGVIFFGDAADNDIGRIRYNHPTDSMRFWTNNAERVRIESDGKVGIGTDSPDGRLHVMKGSAGSVTASGDGNAFVIESDDVAGMTLLSPGDGAIYFGDAADNDEGRIVYKHSDNSMNLWTNNAVRLTIDSSGDATFTGDVTVQDITASDGGCSFGNGQAATIAVDAKTGTNATGNNLTITAGAGTGTGTPGIMTFQVPTVTGSGSGSQSQLNNMVLSQAGTSIYWGGLGTLGNDEGVGEIAYFGTADGTDTLAAGRLMYMNTSGVWKYCDADAVATGATQLLAIALGAAVTDGLLLKGFFKLNSYVEGTWNEGLPCYVSEAASEIDFTQPSGSGDFIRIVGYAIDSTNVIYFNPDSTHIEL